MVLLEQLSASPLTGHVFANHLRGLWALYRCRPGADSNSLDGQMRDSLSIRVVTMATDYNPQNHARIRALMLT